MPKGENTEDSKALHIFLRGDWHEWLRRRAFEERVSIAELVRRGLETAYPDLPPREDTEEGRKGGIVYPEGGTPALVLCDRG